MREKTEPKGEKEKKGWGPVGRGGNLTSILWATRPRRCRVRAGFLLPHSGKRRQDGPGEGKVKGEVGVRPHGLRIRRTRAFCVGLISGRFSATDAIALLLWKKLPVSDVTPCLSRRKQKGEKGGNVRKTLCAEGKIAKVRCCRSPFAKSSE